MRATEQFRERPNHMDSRFGNRSRPNRRLSWWYEARKAAVADGTLQRFLTDAPCPYPRALHDDPPNWMESYDERQRLKIDAILKRSITLLLLLFLNGLPRAEHLRGSRWGVN